MVAPASVGLGVWGPTVTVGLAPVVADPAGGAVGDVVAVLVTDALAVRVTAGEGLPSGETGEESPPPWNKKKARPTDPIATATPAPMSASRTVLMPLAPAGPIAAPGTIETPHTGHATALPATGAPHASQNTASAAGAMGVPHASQNAVPVASSAPQFEQVMAHRPAGLNRR